MANNLIQMIAGKLTSRVDEKLHAAEERLAGLDAQRAELALAVATDTPGAAGKLTELEKQIVAVRNDVDRMREARRLAIERDDRAELEARKKLRQSQFSALRAHADARLKAAKEIAAGIETAALAYRRYLTATEKMIAAVPIGCKMPPGANLGYAQSEIAAELYRHSGISQIGDRGAMPGANPPTEFYRYTPATIPPIEEVIGAANSYILNNIKDQAFGDEARADAAE